MESFFLEVTEATCEPETVLKIIAVDIFSKHFISICSTCRFKNR